MDLRKERTLNNLSQAMVDLLHEKTLEQISVSEICERAMVRRATFYRHFVDKTDLFQYVLKERREKIMKHAVPDGDALDFRNYCHVMSVVLARFVVEHLSILEHQRLRMEFAQEMNDIADQIAQDLARRYAEENGLSEPDADSYMTSYFYSSGLLGVIRWWSRNNQNFDETALAQILESFSIRAFAK